MFEYQVEQRFLSFSCLFLSPFFSVAKLKNFFYLKKVQSKELCVTFAFHFHLFSL